jgi:titin
VHISGLADSTSYTFRVRARNALGASAASNARSVTTLTRTVPAVSRVVVAYADYFGVSCPTCNYSYVGFQFLVPADGGYPITGYQYQINAGAWVFVPNSAISFSYNTGYITTSALVGDACASRVAVRAVNALGAAPASPSVTMAHCGYH